MAPKGKGVVGKVVMRKLDSVRPNDYNPNELTERSYQSLKHGFETDGWLISQSLLIWGKDDKGEERNQIIDGEHRWRVGRELGFEEGPMVILNGLTEVQAKALTVKMDARRGQFNQDILGTLLREIQFDLGTDALGLELGFEDDAMMKLLAEPVDALPVPPAAEGPAGEASSGAPLPPVANIRLVQLFFSEEQHKAFKELLDAARKKFGTKNETETVVAAVKLAVGESDAPPAPIAG